MSDVPEAPLLQLPKLPETIRTLRPIESEELAAEHTNLPKTLDDCITCRGVKSFRWYADEDYTQVGTFACTCDEQYIAHRYFLRAGIPLNYQRLTWLDLHTVDDKRDAAVSDYLEHAEAYQAAGVGLMLTGPQGTGKTFLAALVLKELLQKGFSGTMLDSAKLVTAYMATWDREIGTRAKARLDRDVRNVDVLVVDDLARERQGGAHDQNSRSAAESALEDIFRHRVQSCLPTIVTTNRSGTTLGEIYGSHITTVLQECSIEVDFTGANGRPETKSRTLTETRAGVTRPIFYG